jgi:DNA-directed RNA polymerase specialized sigma24 family protein
LREAKRNDPYAVLDIQAALAALPARDRALIEESGEFGAITRQAKEAGVSIKKMQRRIYEIRETIRAALT